MPAPRCQRRTATRQVGNIAFRHLHFRARSNALSCGSSNRSDGVRTGENGMFASSMIRSRSAIATSRTIAATISRRAGRFLTRSALVVKRSSASRSAR